MVISQIISNLPHFPMFKVQYLNDCLLHVCFLQDNGEFISEKHDSQSRLLTDSWGYSLIKVMGNPSLGFLSRAVKQLKTAT